VRRFLDKGDSKSTSNLRKHGKKCWGDEIIAVADKAKTADDVRQVAVGGTLTPQLITTMFERVGVIAKKTVTYSNRPHTQTETR
jgi:hypothetical protein